jgi:hypothetical protein
MLPTSFGEIESSAEQRLFDAISGITGKNDWVVIHSQGLSKVKTKKQSEVDFLVFVPKKGIVVIECKGAKRVSIDGSNWVLEGLPEKSKYKNPFLQADDAMRAIRGMLKANGFSDVDQIPMARLVWLPWIENRSLFSIGTEFETWELALYEDLSAPELAILKALDEENRSKQGNRSIHYKPGNFTADQMASYVRLIRTSAEVEMSLDLVSRERSSAVKNAASAQGQILELLAQNHWLFFEGEAGTGKTVLLTECARRWVTEGRRVLYVCYNEMLAAEMQETFGANPRVDVFTFNGLLLKLAGKRKNPTKPSATWFDEDLPRLALERMESTGRYPLYEAMCVDEFQDLSTRPEIFKAITSLLDGSTRPAKVALAADDDQQINTNGTFVNSFRFLEENSFPFVHVGLNTNCRQAPRLTAAINRLLNRRATTTRHLIAKTWDATLEVISTSAELQQKHLYRVLKRLLKSYKPKDIRVLSPFGERSSVLGRLTRSDVFESDEVLNLKRLTAFPDSGGEIRWRSIPKFKGLENDVIVVTDISSESADWLSGHGQSLERNLYVGLSRARFHAVLLVQDNLYPATHNVDGKHVLETSKDS